VTVFADGRWTAHRAGAGLGALAILHARPPPDGEELRHLSIVDSVFTGRVVGRS